MNIKHSAVGILQKLARRTSEHLLLSIREDQAEDKKELMRIMSSTLDGIEGTSGPVELPSPANVRALRHAPNAFAASIPASVAELQQAAISAFGYVNWAEYYAENNWSRPFLSEFAKGEGVGPNGVLKNREVILGLFLLGPNTVFPPHAQAADGFCIVLSGDASFQLGSSAQSVQKLQGEVVVHRSNEAHAIQTYDTPLFAIYGWTGAINELGWYRDDMNDNSEPKKYPEIRMV